MIDKTGGGDEDKSPLPPLMIAEYWKTLLLGKPRTWFYATLSLFGLSVVLVSFQQDAELSGLVALMLAVCGWVQTMDPGLLGLSQVQKTRRSWFSGMAVLACIPFLASAGRKQPDGTPDSFVGHVYAVGNALFHDLFDEAPPLGVRHERRQGSSVRNVDVLIITNKSGYGVVPTRALIRSGSSVVPLSLPPIIKPYDSIEVILQSEQVNILLQDGDRMTLTCEGFTLPLTVKF